MSMESFGRYVSALSSTSPEFAEFSRALQAPDTLKAFAHAAGYELTDEEADRIVAMTRSGADVVGPDGVLSESMLDGINGGVNWAAVGALAVGSIAGIATAVVTAPAAAGAAAIWGVAMVAGATGAGGAVGAIGGAIANAFTGD